jgi:hypothetical protein
VGRERENLMTSSPGEAVDDGSWSRTPEQIARLLVVVDTAHLAQVMATADEPAVVKDVALVAEGFPLGDDEYLPYGTTVDVTVHGIGCAEVQILLPGADAPVRFRARDLEDQTFTTSFTATVPGAVRVSVRNGAGQESPDVSARALRVLEPPPPVPIVFGDIDLGQIDARAFGRLAEQWSRHREYSLDLDSADYAQTLQTISAATRQLLNDQRAASRYWTDRLRSIITSHPVPRSRAGAVAARLLSAPYTGAPAPDRRRRPRRGAR